VQHLSSMSDSDSSSKVDIKKKENESTKADNDDESNSSASSSDESIALSSIKKKAKPKKKKDGDRRDRPGKTKKPVGKRQRHASSSASSPEEDDNEDAKESEKVEKGDDSVNSSDSSHSNEAQDSAKKTIEKNTHGTEKSDASSDSDSDNENLIKLKADAKPTQTKTKHEEAEKKETTVKKKAEDGDTSDTSIESENDEESLKRQSKNEKKESAKRELGKKRKMEKHPDGDDDEAKPTKRSKTTPTAGDASVDSPRLRKLKRCVIAAGVRFNYKEMFADIQSDKKKIRKLEEALHSKGVEGAINLQTCKLFRLKKEQAQEIADLLADENIIKDVDESVGRLTRARHAQHRVSSAPHKSRIQKASSSSEDDEPETVPVKCKELFAGLKDCISDESDSGERQ